MGTAYLVAAVDFGVLERYVYTQLLQLRDEIEIALAAAVLLGLEP